MVSKVVPNWVLDTKQLGHKSNSCDTIVSNWKQYFYQKIYKFIVPFCRYKGVSPYRAKKNTKKMDDISFQVDIKW